MKRLGTLLAVVALALTVAAPATASTDVLVLSSWNPTFEGREAIGGLQEVTAIVPSTPAQMGATVDLVPPCDCRIEAAVPSHGEVAANVWAITGLPAGASATLEIRWVSTATGGHARSTLGAALGYRLVGSFLAT